MSASVTAAVVRGRSSDISSPGVNPEGGEVVGGVEVPGCDVVVSWRVVVVWSLADPQAAANRARTTRTAAILVLFMSI
jgi:hypothetical protein